MTIKAFGHELLYGALTLYGTPFQEIYTHAMTPVMPSLETTIQSVKGHPELELGLFPRRSPLLGESRLVSFPPLNDMLKFGG